MSLIQEHLAMLERIKTNGLTGEEAIECAFLTGVEAGIAALTKPKRRADAESYRNELIDTGRIDHE